MALQGERERHPRTHNELLVLLPFCVIKSAELGGVIQEALWFGVSGSSDEMSDRWSAKTWW